MSSKAIIQISLCIFPSKASIFSQNIRNDSRNNVSADMPLSIQADENRERIERKQNSYSYLCFAFDLFLI